MELHDAVTIMNKNEHDKYDKFCLSRAGIENFFRSLFNNCTINFV